MTISDQGVHLTREQVDAGHQGHRSVALVLVVAANRGMGAGNRRQIGSGRADRLDAGFLVNETTAISRHLDLPVNAQNLRHFRLELGIAPLQVVAHPVRLDLVRGENLAHRSLGQLGQARMAGARPVVPRMRRQQAGGPQLVRVAELGRLRTSQRNKSSSCLRRNEKHWPKALGKDVLRLHVTVQAPCSVFL
jgi:hypothetical protein